VLQTAAWMVAPASGLDKERAAKIRQILDGSQQKEGRWVDHPKSRLLPAARSIMTVHGLEK